MMFFTTYSRNCWSDRRRDSWRKNSIDKCAQTFFTLGESSYKFHSSGTDTYTIFQSWIPAFQSAVERAKIAHSNPLCTFDGFRSYFHHGIHKLKFSGIHTNFVEKIVRWHQRRPFLTANQQMHQCAVRPTFTALPAKAQLVENNIPMA